MQLCLIKLSVILEIDPYVISLDVFNERIFIACQQKMIPYYM